MGEFFAFFGGLLVFGGWFFWLQAVVASIVLAYLVEEGRGFFATLTLIVSLLLLQFLSSVKVFSYVFHQPVSVLFWAGIYIAAGIIWSIGKWAWSLFKLRGEIGETKENFLRSHRVEGTEIPDNLQKEWSQYFHQRIGYSESLNRFASREEIPPLAKHNKAMIVRWAVYWPWSVLGTFFSDWVTEFFSFLFRLISRIYQAIADRMFKDIKKDLPKKDMGD